MACLPVASRLHHVRIVAQSMKDREERRKELAAGKKGGGGVDGGYARQEIEVRLMEARWRMADAEADQDFSLCTRLQRDIKNLEVGFGSGARWVCALPGWSAQQRYRQVYREEHLRSWRLSSRARWVCTGVGCTAVAPVYREGH